MHHSELFQPKMKQNATVYEFCKYYLFIIILLDVSKMQMSVHDNNHAFIQANNNDVRLMGVHDGLRVFMHQDVASSGVRITDMHENFDNMDSLSSSNCLKFVPPQLDFKERYLGVPHLERVTLVNTDENKTIHMSSVSGNTLHFHSSFFQDKTIPPKGNTSFAVVFLGRNRGQVSSTLFIHTSEGTFKYQVSGASIESPYRLRPLGGVKLPLHAAFQSMIHLHNPHHFPIQVVEVYSSGSEFHLELPGGEIEGPKTLWEVPPYTTKPVIRATFQADATSNHTAYIRMKLNNTEQVLIVPLEVEVSSQSGLYSSHHVLDFGFGGSLDRPKKLKLYLCNSSKKSLRIQNIATIPPTNAVHVDFEPLRISSGTSPVQVAELTFDWSTGFSTGQTSGKIMIKTKQSLHKLFVPYTATVFQGGLEIDETATRFLTTDAKFQPRNVTVSNKFKIPVAINNVSLLGEASKYFQIKKFKPMVIPPDKSVAILTISARENTLKNLKLNSQLVLHTNISQVAIPVLSYNGKLTKIFPPGFEDLELLDFGLVSSGAVKKIKFGLQNNNPVPVELRSVSSDSLSITPKLLGVYNGNISSFMRQFSFSGTTNLTKIKPNSIAVLEVGVHAPSSEEVISADITVVSQYENLVLPVKASVAHGTLEVVPKPIVIDECFPGKVCTYPLNVRSTFNRPMTVTGVSSVPPDPRLGFINNAGNPEILPSSSSQIGELKWEPGKYCGNHCYLGVHNNATSGILQWSQSDVLPPYTSDADATLIRDKYQRFLNLTKGIRSGFWQDLILRLDTNEVREQPFKAKVKLIWPRISNASKLAFPLTQVMNTTIQRLKLVNSASHAVIVQLVMEWAYPQAKRLLDSFPQSLKPHCGEHCFNSTNKEFFILKNFPKFSESYGIVNASLDPGESYEAIISYRPQAPHSSYGLLFVRSNLTIIEVVELQGQGAFAQLKFGNRKPGSENPLAFEITEKHLKDCSREKNRKSQAPNLTVKRSFVARNVGDLPIFVHGFRINGLDCEGYGFSVLNCEPFLLAANGTKKIDVAFTPDFTLSKIQRTLTVETSSGIEANYTLVTTLPPFFLSACSSVLTRPAWEPLLYYSAVSFMVFLLFCVLAAAFFESDRILKCALMTMARDRNAAPLDLRQIGTGVAKEFAVAGHGGKKQTEPDADRPEKNKHNQPSGCETGGGPCWPIGFSADDRRYSVVSNDEKYDSHEKADESVEYFRDKERSTCFRSSPVRLNNCRKSNKKSRNKNSNNSEILAEANSQAPPEKKKDKNVGWCGVFSKESGNNEKPTSKIGGGVNESATSLKQIRNDIETNKPDSRKEERKAKKNSNKGPSRQDEDSSSTTTDSSNDAEKDASLDPRTRAINEKSRKSADKKTKQGPLENKDSYEGDCDDDDFEKDRKTVRSKNLWKVNCKTSKLVNNVSDASANIWKSNANENDQQRNVDFSKTRGNKNNIARDRKDKNSNKRRFVDKTGIQKDSQVSTPHASSPCWEHRSFSDVVARNENPLLRSSVLASKSNQQTQYVSDSGYTEGGKRCESSCTSLLGPIGSKKPPSNWSSMVYNNTCHQRNLIRPNYSDQQNRFTEVNWELGREQPSTCLDDTLSHDLENLWDDRHPITQPCSRPENHFQLSWKDNWTDFWGNNRNIRNDGSLAVHDGLTEQSWSSFLRSSWSPSPWSPSTGHILEDNMDVGGFANYHDLSEAQNLVGCLQNSTLPSAVSPDRTCDVLDRNHFGRNSIASDTPQTSVAPAGDESNSLCFDSFHSLNSIWSPKAPDTWTSPGGN